jgi:polyphenol oxidase
VQWRERDGTRWLEAELGQASAAFTTRIGGVSAAPFESLNLGLLTGDDPGAVRTNRHRAAAALGLEPDRFLIGRQVHGAEIQARDEPPEPNGFAEPGSVEPAEVDGQATAGAGLVPLVFVADCLPVALSGPEGVAMIHCGWRGLAKGIVALGVQAVGATRAAIGPGIGRCCYEVGDEVLDAFAPLGEGIADGRMLDLAEVARRLLARAGVDDVEAAGLCTSCEPELFFSHRRDDGRTGRQAGLVWERAGDG